MQTEQVLVLQLQCIPQYFEGLWTLQEQVLLVLSLHPQYFLLLCELQLQLFEQYPDCCVLHLQVSDEQLVLLQ